MTCIAWDGKTLAADRQGELGWIKTERTKIQRHGDMLIGGAGAWHVVRALVEWVKDGRSPEKFPKCAEDGDGIIIVVFAEPRSYFIYEKGPHSAELENKFFAIGSGGDAAMAAMHLGHDARRAVEVAIEISKGCGGGIDTLTL